MTIIADHEDFLIIDKEPDVGFHQGHGEEGLLNIMRRETGIGELFPVHRLDKMSSGLLLFARNKEAARTFSQYFQGKQIEKYYIAIANRKPSKKQGLICGDMQRSRRSTWKLCRSNNHPAITRFFSTPLNEGRRLFILRPYTGRTHQLRVAMKSIGAPILGDQLYGPDPADRGYLHAYALRFPWQGKLLEFRKPPAIGKYFTDHAFLAAVPAFEEPWKLPWPVAKSGASRSVIPNS